MKKLHFNLLILSLTMAWLVGCQHQPIERVTFPTVNLTFQANADTTLFGAQGTRIFIPANTFQFPDGSPVEDSIRIELKEFYTKSDIILAELPTVSDGKLLETGGMIYLKAFANNQEVQVKADRSLVVHFPKKPNNYNKMDLFYADQNATDTSVNNWEVNTKSLVKRTLKLGSYAWWAPAHDDSTIYSFIPKNYVDTGYYWNPIDFYVKSYPFSDETVKAIESTMNITKHSTLPNWNDYGAECEMGISVEGFIQNPKVVTKLPRNARNEVLKFLRGLPQLEPGKNKHGEIIPRRGLLFIQGGKTVPLYETHEAYVQSFNAKYAQFEDQPIKSMDDAELNYYIFNVTKLGWINCDRFVEFEAKTDLIVEMPPSSNLKLKLAFSSVNGVLKPTFQDGNYVFRQVPVGEQATLIGINQSDEELLAAFEEITISDQPIKRLQFAEVTLSELRQQLDAL